VSKRAKTFRVSDGAVTVLSPHNWYTINWSLQFTASHIQSISKRHTAQLTPHTAITHDYVQRTTLQSASNE
jgi:hypothetical protein